MSARHALLLGAVLALVCSDTASATGLYKGHGRRTRDYSWTWRANGSIGFHSIEDPWDQFGVNSYPIGGYTNFGIELATLPRQSLEIVGAYRWVNDRRDIVNLVGVPRPGIYSYEVRAWTAGATWRTWFPRGSSAGFLGFGGGWVFASDLSYREEYAGSAPYFVDASGQGPEVHVVFGFDGIPGPNVRMGMELGFRYSWVDFDNGIYGAGNFRGIYLGFRVGITNTR